MWVLRWVFNQGWRLFECDEDPPRKRHKHHKHKVKLVVPDPTKAAKWGGQAS